MLQLALIRHAKSSWSDATLADFERPLNKRGLKNAPMMGKLIHRLGISLDEVVSSPALRAITTARLIAAELNYPEKRIRLLDELYLADLDDLLQCAHSLDSKYKHVALVGHNPGFTDFCNYLSGENIANLPTCAVALIEFDLDDWRAVHRDSGKLARFEYPKKHTD